MVRFPVAKKIVPKFPFAISFSNVYKDLTSLNPLVLFIKFFVFIVCSVPINDYIETDSEKILPDVRIFWIATVD